MKKSFLISVLLGGMFGIGALFLTSSGVGAHTVIVNKRDLSEHGLLLLVPTDPLFDEELAKLGVMPNRNERHLIAVTKPFSVIVRNESLRDVVAYRLRWDVIQPNGTLTTHLRTYAEPGALMGNYLPHGEELPGSIRLSIKSKSNRYVSLAGSIGSSGGSPIATGIIAGNSDPSQLNQFGIERNDKALIDILGNELSRSESLTVTLDAALFDDGTFVGPDSFNYFHQINAQVQAKADLLRNALNAAQHNKPLAEVFEDAEGLANDKNGQAALQADSPPSDYYKFYKREFAKELLRMRANTRDDKAAVWLATRPLYRRWAKLAKKQ